MNIQQVIEKNKGRIFSKNFPATAAGIVLCEEFGYSYFYAKREFFKYCKKNNFLAVHGNF